MNAWRDFKGGKWQDRIDVRDFIQKNYTPYTGDESFLQPPTARTEKMLEKYEALCRAEQQNGGVLNIDTETVITATSFETSRCVPTMRSMLPRLSFLRISSC